LERNQSEKNTLLRKDFQCHRGRPSKNRSTGEPNHQESANGLEGRQDLSQQHRAAVSQRRQGLLEDVE